MLIACRKDSVLEIGAFIFMGNLHKEGYGLKLMYQLNIPSRSYLHV